MMDNGDFTLGQHLFWDADYLRLNMVTHADYIIPRVMDYGDWKDVKQVFKYYGLTAIREVLVLAPSLQIRTIHFFAHFYALPLASFKAYDNIQRNNWKR